MYLVISLNQNENIYNHYQMLHFRSDFDFEKSFVLGKFFRTEITWQIHI